jgi:hypothetical protein
MEAKGDKRDCLCILVSMYVCIGHVQVSCCHVHLGVKEMKKVSEEEKEKKDPIMWMELRA